MAMGDYYQCDVCGCKAFYDANLHYEEVQPPVAYGASGQKLGNVGDMAVICDDCSKTHEVVIRMKEDE